MVATHTTSCSGCKLYDVCRIRSSYRIKGMKRFQTLFIPLVRTFEEFLYSDNTSKYNDHTKVKSKYFLKLIEDFDFIVVLVICRSILNMTQGVTLLLQGPTREVVEGLDLIRNLVRQFWKVRNNVDQFHGKWYQEALGFLSY